MTNILPYVGQVLLIAILATILVNRFVFVFKLRNAVIGIVIVLGMFLPVAGLTLGQWIRSVVGDFSVFTLVVFANILAQRLFHFSLLHPTSRNSLLLGIVLLGLIFYPLALGLSSFDPYHLGYAPGLMSVLLCLGSLVAWIKTRYDLAIVLLLPLIAFNLHLLESYNLWDYLLDPILLLYILVQIFVATKEYFLERRRMRK